MSAAIASAKFQNDMIIQVLAQFNVFETSQYLTIICLSNIEKAFCLAARTINIINTLKQPTNLDKLFLNQCFSF